jgi:hypothetical protein
MKICAGLKIWGAVLCAACVGVTVVQGQSSPASRGVATAPKTSALAKARAPATTTAPATSQAATASTQAKTPETPDEIKQAFEHGEYALAVRGISRLLDPKHALDYDRMAMLMLRGECEFQMKQTTQALGTFDAIRKQAHKDADKKDEAQAAAIVFLIRKSPGLLYTPKTASDKTPINILDRGRRQEAYRKLYDDELAVAQQMAKEAAFGTSLAPIMAVCEELYSVQAVERLLTNDIVNTKKVAQQLLRSAQGIISAAIVADDAILTNIANASHRVGKVQVGGNNRGPIYSNQAVGVGPAQQRQIAGIMSDCDGVIDLIGRLQFMADQPNALDGLLDRTIALKARGQSVAAGGW